VCLVTGVACLGGAFPAFLANTALEFDEALITLTELAHAAIISSVIAKRLAEVTSEKLFD
jgi:hypothetical protein